MLAAGEAAPVFVAPGTDGDLDLSSLLAAGTVILYFFPRAFTPG